MPQRVILGEINGNRRRKELSSHTRCLIYGLYDGGVSYRKISARLGIPYTTVANTIQKRDLRPDRKTPLRPGRPPILSKRASRSILLTIRRDPFITYKRLALNSFQLASRSTIYRTLKKYGITNYIVKRRPHLKAIHARKRLEWYLERVNWPAEQWNRIIWTDECSLERGKGRPREWVFRKPKEQWQKDKITTYKTGKETRVMVWGAFNGTRRSQIVRIRNDPTSPR